MRLLLALAGWLALGIPCALPFWRGALAGLARREITMDVPVVLGVAISLGASIAAISASATMASATNASQANRTMLPRFLIFFTLISSRSPGTTGLRNLALSMVRK